MTDRNTISQVIESLFDDWIDKNRNAHPLEVENMRLLKADALSMLKEQEAVVRCKDCKHWNNDEIIKSCKRHLGFGYFGNWFCADGERKASE